MSRFILSPEARDDLLEIADHIAQDSPKTARRVVRELKAAMQRLKEEAEKAKKELSTAQEAEVNLPFLTADADGPKHFEFPESGRPAIQTTDRQFEAYYLAHLTQHITRQFYDHDQLDTVAEDAAAL